eukprot:6189887-Pleurochrysis_carterae.AAC.10
MLISKEIRRLNCEARAFISSSELLILNRVSERYLTASVAMNGDDNSYHGRSHRQYVASSDEKGAATVLRRRTDSGHLKVAWPVSRAITVCITGRFYVSLSTKNGVTRHAKVNSGVAAGRAQHTFGCIQTCFIFAVSLVGMQPVKAIVHNQIVATATTSSAKRTRTKLAARSQ